MHEIDSMEWNFYMELMEAKEAKEAKEERDRVYEQKKNASELLQRFGI